MEYVFKIAQTFKIYILKTWSYLTLTKVKLAKLIFFFFINMGNIEDEGQHILGFWKNTPKSYNFLTFKIELGLKWKKWYPWKTWNIPLPRAR
jgi:hypothetical protein